MQLAVQDLEERARWVISVRWLACLLVVVATFLTSTVLGLLPWPAPLYAIAAAMLAYNTALHHAWRRDRPRPRSDEGARRALFGQVTLDLVALTLLLYFADLTHNPLVACYFFHIVITSILLPGAIPYFLAGLASLLVGTVVLLEHLGVIPIQPLDLSAPSARVAYLLGSYMAFAGCLGVTVYFATSVSRHVERAHAKIRQQERMLGISQLVAGFAHQINNPLDGLQNCLRQVATRVGDDGGTLATLRMMQAGLDRMARLARRLQEFARPGGLQVAPMELAATVDAVIPLLEGPCGERKVVLEKDVAHVPPVLGDPYSVQEVLFNLCTNALDAMPDGGRLSIRVVDPQRPEIGERGGVAIEVVDTGIGVPSDRLLRIFEPFYTTKADKGGTGLGLGLCRMLVSEMGGTIEVRSALGRGSMFRVILPAATVQVAQGA